MGEVVDDATEETRENTSSSIRSGLLEVSNELEESEEIEENEKDANKDDDRKEGHPVIDYPESIYSGTWERIMFAGIVAFAANISTLSIPIYFPALTTLANAFHTSVERINVTATVYSIFQGISPVFWATISDSSGRRPVYFVCCIIAICANVGLALSPNYAALLCLRCLQAFGAASTVALYGGVVGDFTTRRDRGGLMGICTGLSQVGNCIGPIIGGLLIYRWDWPSIFWFLAALSGFILVLMFLLLPESNRRFCGTGSRVPRTLAHRSPYIWVRHRLKGVPYYPSEPEYEQQWCLPPAHIDWRRFWYLIKQPDTILVLVPVAMHYTTWYMVLTAQSTQLIRFYEGFDELKAGFTYVASGVGSILASFGTGKFLQWNYKRSMDKFRAECQYKGILYDASQFNIYQARLSMSFYASLLLIVTTIIFGWTLEYRISFYVPVIMTFFIALSASAFLNIASTLLVDLFPSDSAASQSCNNLARCLLCAVGLAAVDRMMSGMGVGGCFTLMAGFCALTLICIYSEMRWGSRIAARRNANSQN